MRPLIFGEVLFDRFPDGRSVLGGAPFNVAWNLQALGAAPHLVSRVGDDELGARIKDAMDAWGMDRGGLQTDPDHATGTVEVTLEDDEPSYEIAADRAWDHIAAPSAVPDAGLLYHGSLALRAPESAAAMAALRRDGTDVFMDVNLRDPWWDRETVRALLRAARWAKLNGEELDRLVPEASDREDRIAALLGEGRLERIIVTLGADGAAVHGRDVEPLVRPAAPRGPVVDTVGAGDAFSAVVIVGLLRGWDWACILDRAQELAGAVVGLRGATTDDRGFYDTFTAAWEPA